MSLPLALMVVTTNVLTCLGQMALIASASAWIALSFPFLFVVFYLLQKFYLKTSRQMRLLDLEAKAPVYTQFVETLDGLATIRAFGWTQLSVERNHELVDHSQKPNYLMYAIQKWLALVLDLIITAIAVLIVGIVVGTRDSSGPGFTGVSLTQIISFASNVKLLIMFWTSMETSLGAVARIKQFEQENLAEDQPGETHDAPFDWPNQGAIEISNLSAKHKSVRLHIPWLCSQADLIDRRDSERLTLDKISISIAAGSKVSFCGRTGCGKSSLLLTLFNLLTPQSGSIKIDGRDISSIRRESLRSRLICMAEEPYLLPKSVRENLGFDSMTVTDAEMMKVLQQTGLEDVIASHGGLDAMIDGVFLSQGQKQLLNIARALLKKKHGKVLIMDEATSRYVFLLCRVHLNDVLH
jgi:ATP-binding cassette subfamily C (CFTR/MRP) protein 1